MPIEFYLVGTAHAMDVMRRIAFILSAAVSLGFVSRSGAQTSEQLEQAAGDLGANEFAKRQAATDLLWQAGPKAKEVLERLVRSPDPEIRARASAILNQLRLGIRPETPAEVTALIDQFRFAATPIQRRQALIELQTKGHWQAILTLIRGERDPETRTNLATALLSDAGRVVRPLVERGMLDEAEEVLDLIAMSEAGYPQWTAFLILTDRLDRALSIARQRAETTPSMEAWQKLAYLARARGDLDEARAAAERSGDLLLQTNLHAEAGLWSEAARTTAEILKTTNRKADVLAFAATFSRLAGNQDEHERHMEALLKTAGVSELTENPPPATPGAFGRINTGGRTQSAWTAVEALLVNERLEEALTLLKKINPRFAHAMLWRQQRHREAMEYVKIPREGPLDRAWFDSLPAPAGDANSQQENRFLLGLQVARQLRELGRSEQMVQAIETLRGMAPEANDRGRRLSLIATLEWQLGRYEDMARDAERAIAAGALPVALFNAIDKQYGSDASVWYDEFLANHWPNDRQKAFLTAIWMASANTPKGMLPEDWRDMVAAAAKRVESLRPTEKGLRMAKLSRTCQNHGDLELAMKYAREAETLDPRLPMVAGDLMFEQQDWQGAAEAYRRTGEAVGGNAQMAFFLGYCLTKSGEEAAGKKEMLLAKVHALAPEAKLGMATGLHTRKLKSEAEEQVQLLRKTALPDSPVAASAAQFWATLVQKEQPREAAHAWQQQLLHVLNASGSFPEMDHYLRFVHQIHKARGVAAAKAGRREEAAAEFAVCERVLPGDVNLAVDVAPLLDQQGMQDLAAMLVERGVASLKTTLEDFPKSATNWNNAAWVLARGQRQLDQALQMAEKAVELSPNESSYQDTLAEVHFQRGDREAAVAAATRAAELLPFSPLFAKRLAHFQKDELKSLDAGEGD